MVIALPMIENKFNVFITFTHIFKEEHHVIKLIFLVAIINYCINIAVLLYEGVEKKERERERESLCMCVEEA